MTGEELEFIEKVKLPEYEGYGWGNATKIIRDLIAEVRILQRKLDDAKGGRLSPLPSDDERSG